MASSIGRLLTGAIPVTLFLLLLAASWRRWTSPIADSGREMDLPLRMLEGEWLYRDVHYLYPPFAPYFNSLLYRLFGAHLDVLLGAGMVCSALLAWLCYRIARRVLSPFDASATTAAVIVLCIFKPSGNLISPYAYAALYGMLFALGALLFTLRYAEAGRKMELLTAGLMIGLAGVSKQEFGLAAALTVTGAVIHLHRSNLWSVIRDLAAAALPAALVGMPVYGLAFYFIGWETLVRDCHIFYTHLPSSLVFYNAQRTGMDRPFFSLLQMLGGASVGMVVLSAGVLIADRTGKTYRSAGLTLAASGLSALAIALIAGRQWDGSPLRALPLLLAAVIFIEWRQAPAGLEDRRRKAALFILAIYSLAILARVTLRVPSGGAFGGFFLPTSLIVFYHLYLNLLPAGLERWTGDRVSSDRARRFARIILVATMIVMAGVFCVRYRKNFNYPIEAARGRMVAPAVTGSAIDRALRFIQSKTKPSDPIVILPEGADLAFLTGRRSPLRHQILIPGLMLPADETRAIETMRRLPVRYALIVNRPMREFGAEAFGTDFYRNLGRFIETNYRLVEVYGRNSSDNPRIGDPDFFIKIYELN
ncbi:MAG: glycosyltransferase family 39 protein [Acidobacteriota bacterium]|nr:MAG: glycosyltransferase family 39 protein [Acidobacteriota bacterium]